MGGWSRVDGYYYSDILTNLEQGQTFELYMRTYARDGTQINGSTLTIASSYLDSNQHTTGNI